VYKLTQLRTLDLSHNQLTDLGPLGVLHQSLKTLHLNHNQLPTAALKPLVDLVNLQTLTLSHNMHLGHGSLPPVPPSLQQLNLSQCGFKDIPQSLLSLPNLVKLNLSNNQISRIPDNLTQWKSLQDLNLDNNQIAELPDSTGDMSSIKVLSLKQNRLAVSTTTSNRLTARDKQPIPARLLKDTPLVDLNLHGNPMTNAQLHQFDGFDEFLERRAKVNTKTMTAHDVCGLE
jgi:Leucine-rich repeat (LRR) protein